MQKTIELNSVAVDWITLTSDGGIQLDRLGSMLVLEYMGTASTPTRQNFMQYKGQRWECGHGTLFYGYYHSDKAGEQSILQISGELAHMVLGECREAVSKGIARVTRVDIQTTVVQPEDWESIRFFNRMERNGRSPQWRSSVDKKSKKELITVSVGSRESEVYARVYNKVTNAGVMLIRFEGEYKGAKARAIFHDMGEHTTAQMIKWHVQRLKDEQLDKCFTNALHGISPHWAKASVKEVDKTAEWLLSSALPAFKRVISQHGGDSGVSMAFMEALMDQGKWGKDD